MWCPPPIGGGPPWESFEILIKFGAFWCNLGLFYTKKKTTKKRYNVTFAPFLLWSCFVVVVFFSLLSFTLVLLYISGPYNS